VKTIHSEINTDKSKDGSDFIGSTYKENFGHNGRWIQLNEDRKSFERLNTAFGQFTEPKSNTRNDKILHKQ